MEENQQSVGNTFSIKRVRESLASTIGVDLINEGFKIDKKLNGAKKSINKKNKIEVKFDLYDYLPSSIEFRLVIIFSLAEIDNEAELLYKFSNEIYNRGFTIILAEGDFHPKTKELNAKSRNAATHILTDIKRLDEAINDCRGVLHHEIIPSFNRYIHLNAFQDYIFDDLNVVIKYGLLVPSLIAAKLKGRAALDKLVGFLWKTLELDSKTPEYLIRKLVTNIYVYDK